MGQKLSPEAKAEKAKRDKNYAMTPGRRAKKAENQRLRRLYLKRGFKLAGLDYDHEDKKFESVKRNRGNDGNGTKTETT
jgi:hypothetical protein